MSIMAGFPYADVPDMGPAVIAVHEAIGSRQSRCRGAGDQMWRVRHELTCTARRRRKQCSTWRLAADRIRSLLVDLGDNIGGGSAGDGTVLLAEISAAASGAIVVLYAPEAVMAAKNLGVRRVLYRNGSAGNSTNCTGIRSRQRRGAIDPRRQVGRERSAATADAGINDQGPRRYRNRGPEYCWSSTRSARHRSA